MRSAARTLAAWTYALLSAFALAVLVILVTPLPSLRAMVTVPGAVVMIGCLASLTIASAALAILLWRRAQVSLITVRALAIALPIVAVGWSLIAPLFWLVPLLFVWRQPST